MDQTIYSKMKKMLRDVLDLPEALILPNTYLYRDLSLESGETLELTFMLEQEFSIKIGSQEIWNLPNVLASRGMFSNGRLSSEGVSSVKQYFTVSDEDLPGIASPYDLFNYLTVENMVDFVSAKLEKPEHRV